MAKAKEVKVILVDPFNHTVTQSTVQGSSAAVFDFSRKFMGVSMLDIVRAGKYFGGELEANVLVDDEGLLMDQSQQAFTLIGNKTLAGKLVIVCESGYDDDGDTDLVDVDFSVETVTSRIKFVTRKFAEAAIDLATLKTAAWHVAHGHKVEQVSPGVLFITED